jgi:hypothetical protein
LRYTVVPHPLGHRAEDDLSDLADAAIGEIVAALTGQP